jgi:two-component system LytT family response regulator
MSPDGLRLLIADDEPLARDLLRRYAAAVPGIALVCECTTTEEVAAGLARERPDDALLDSRLPGADMFDVRWAAAAAAPLPSIIFATAYDGYAVRAFEMNAIDYLVKPYSEERFAAAIRRVRDRQHDRPAGRGDSQALGRALRDLGARPDRLLVPDGRKMVAIQVADIEWIKAEGDYVRVFAGGRGYLVGRTLKDLEARLDPARFVRVHRSALVQASHIREVRAEGSSRYNVRLSDGTTVIVSRSRAPELKRWMI